MPPASPDPLRAANEAAPPAQASAEVVSRAVDGDIQAWAELYAAHYRGVFRQVRYLIGDPQEAEELAQETFAQAMASGSSYDTARDFRRWLHGIALNVVRKRRRKDASTVNAHRRLLVIRNTDDESQYDDPDRGHLRNELNRALYLALDEVPERWREAFVLKELEGLSTAEVADLLDISTANVAVRLTRARQRIREVLTRHGWLPAEGES